MTLGVYPVEPGAVGAPFRTWREDQWTAIQAVTNTEKPVVLLEAPTGVGKSGIAVACARIARERTVVLTHTKQLQEQYSNFQGVCTVSGRGNFPCWMLDEGATAEMGPCGLGVHCKYKNPDEDLEGESEDGYYPWCGYYEQKTEAVRSDVAVANYAYWLREANGPGAFSKLDCLILDEAHLAEDALRGYVGTTLSNRAYRKLGGLVEKVPTGSEVSAWQVWAQENHDAIVEAHHRVLAQANKDSLNRKLHSELAEMKALEHTVTTMAEMNDAWVSHVNGYGGIEFKPVWVTPFFYDKIRRHAKRLLLLSATILNARVFASILGVRPDDLVFYQSPSPFPKEIRPVIFSPVMKVSHGVDTGPVIEFVRQTLKAHPNQKGLIHTQSFRLAQSILNSVSDPRLIGHQGQDRARVLEEFKASTEPRVLVSPSMTTGVDLPGDDCRFQIICKLPFPDKSDPQVARRLEVGPDGKPGKQVGSEWYAWTTACALVQAAGRAVRSEDDFAVTYLIDSNFKWFKNVYGHLLPGWFKEAIIQTGWQTKSTVDPDDLPF